MKNDYNGLFKKCAADGCKDGKIVLFTSISKCDLCSGTGWLVWMRSMNDAVKEYNAAFDKGYPVDDILEVNRNPYAVLAAAALWYWTECGYPINGQPIAPTRLDLVTKVLKSRANREFYTVFRNYVSKLIGVEIED